MKLFSLFFENVRAYILNYPKVYIDQSEYIVFVLSVPPIYH